MGEDYHPVMYVFAGNNGSGKSTFRNLLIDKLGIEINIDPDGIARRIDPLNPESKRFEAGKSVIKMVKECIKEGNSFSIETTLAGKNAINQIKAAQNHGFEITMFYLGLEDVKQNIERVTLRVKNGGHHISTEDILRRHIRSRENLIDGHQDSAVSIKKLNFDRFRGHQNFSVKVRYFPAIHVNHH
jgi:predicted ABC-type ATPase